MYEDSFCLKRRPFAATPDASCFLSSEPVRAALDEIVVCVENGQGISVLTAPAGTGKTLLCERLRCELDDRFETVFLRHASFLTRRALLQTILCELNSPYHHPSEQELRLELLPAIRALQPKREALVLICDEAHHLSESLLEELRILADFAEAGRPLVRLVLVGQLSLEEKLVQPSLEAFNQRIRAHVNLTTFDQSGSLDYIDYRVTWAGGRTSEVFTPAALELIARVSDGIPRCINQLADHTLLLAFVADQKPAGEQLVREALNDLRQLPLHWNEPPQSLTAEYGNSFHDDEIPTGVSSTPTDQRASESTNDASTRTFSYEPEPDSDQDNSPVEPISTFSQLAAHDYASFETALSNDANLLDMSGDDWRQTLDLFNSQLTNTGLDDHFAANGTAGPAREIGSFPDETARFDQMLSDAYAAAGLSAAASSLPAAPAVGDFQEELIIDRYAAIDAGLEPPETPIEDTLRLIEVRAESRPDDRSPFAGGEANTRTWSGDSSATGAVEQSPEEELLDDDQVATPWEGTFTVYSNGSFDDARSTFEGTLPDAPVEDGYPLVPHLVPSAQGTTTSDSLLDAIREQVNDLTSSVSGQSSHATPTATDDPSWQSIETPPAQPNLEDRPFRYLFSKLRRKQQGLS